MCRGQGSTITNAQTRAVSAARVGALPQEAVVDLGFLDWLDVVAQNGDLRATYFVRSVACAQRGNEEIDTFLLCSSRSLG
jgi:hypothetical protein